MSRSREGDSDSGLLFDLPLDSAPEQEHERPPGPEAQPPPAVADEPVGDQVALDFPPEGAVEVEPPPLREAPIAPRFLAGLLDLVVLVAVLGLALLAVRALAVPMTADAFGPLTVFLLAFSFLYAVVPLAFWGHTPGMAYTRIMGRGKQGEFLTIQQCMLRWLGWVLTVATLGLAGLIALSGLSLSDLLSRSRLYLRP